MRDVGTSAVLDGRSVRIFAVVIAMTLVGASPNPLPRLAKADRLPSPADCRTDAPAATVDCLGVVLPVTRGEPTEVAPGLTIVGMVAD